MEINAANVSFFFPSFVVQKMDGKKKTNIGELSTKEIQEITDNAVPGTTERSE